MLKCIVYPDNTITQTLKVIDENASRIAIVLNKSDKTVIGTISDGDIRRAILNGKQIDDPINDIYCSTPTVCNTNDPIEKIIQLAISQKLYQIPIVDNNNHLVKIEDLGNMLYANERPNTVVLMAGGLGTRLRPLTEDIPKPLLKVGEKPIIETIIENFAKYGFRNIVISLNYKSEMIQEYFGDGSNHNVKISYIHEDTKLGTAGALSLLKEVQNSPIFVMNGDLLTNINFSHLLDYHILEQSVITMCVREYDFQVPYGVINIDENRVTKIEEKPVHRFFVNAGIYILSPQVLNKVPYNEYYDMPTLIEDMIKEEKKVSSFPIHEYWLDIGRISEFEKAQLDYKKYF